MWAAAGCLWLWPNAAVSTVALVVWLWALPLLAAGRWLRTWEPTYRWPFYVVAYTTALAAIILAVEETAVLSLILFLNVGVAVLSVWLFREPLWWYPAAVMLPMAGWALLVELRFRDLRWYGWTLIAAAALYLAGAWLLRRRGLRRYETPLIVMMFVMLAVGLSLCITERLDAFVGFGAAVVVLTVAAVWLRRPLVLSLGVALAAVPYGVALSWLNVAEADIGLAMWPGIVAAFALAVYLDHIWGVEPRPGRLKLTAFPWTRLWRWPVALWERWMRWWALSLYAWALLFVGVSALISAGDAWRWLLVLVGNGRFPVADGSVSAAGLAVGFRGVGAVGGAGRHPPAGADQFRGRGGAGVYAGDAVYSVPGLSGGAGVVGDAVILPGKRPVAAVVFQLVFAHLSAAFC
ncbi:MAG: hypothetical protein M5U34_20445 [Chloroflexi bacterium]|nr:hypothetical protein [Chloroflexota bacterium]